MNTASQSVVLDRRMDVRLTLNDYLFAVSFLNGLVDH
jgi:hypothetical protein